MTFQISSWLGLKSTNNKTTHNNNLQQAPLSQPDKKDKGMALPDDNCSGPAGVSSLSDSHCQDTSLPSALYTLHHQHKNTSVLCAEQEVSICVSQRRNRFLMYVTLCYRNSICLSYAHALCEHSKAYQQTVTNCTSIILPTRHICYAMLCTKQSRHDSCASVTNKMTFTHVCQAHE